MCVEYLLKTETFIGPICSSFIVSDAHSLASISCSEIVITWSRSHLSAVVARLTISLISGGNLFTRTDVSSPPYESLGMRHLEVRSEVPKARCQ